jgi:serine/threonine-protein kinase
VITVAAVLSVAAALLTWNFAAQANDRPRANQTSQVLPVIIGASSAAASSTPLNQPPVNTTAVGQKIDTTRATYAAHLPDGAGTLYLAVRDGSAVAYLCDGKKLEVWFKGTAAAGKLALTGKNGATIAGSFDATTATGRITVQGRSIPFDVPKVQKPSGLYRAAAKVRNADVQGGWIVLPDGSQVGVLTVADSPEPAPSLDTASRTATVDGTVLVASEIDVNSGAGF